MKKWSTKKGQQVNKETWKFRRESLLVHKTACLTDLISPLSTFGICCIDDITCWTYCAYIHTERFIQLLKQESNDQRKCQFGRFQVTASSRRLFHWWITRCDKNNPFVVSLELKNFSEIAAFSSFIM